MNRKILVIGGTGLLGQPLVNCLNESGFQLRVMTRNYQKARTTFDEAIEIFDGDPMDMACLEEAINGCYGVQHQPPN